MHVKYATAAVLAVLLLASLSFVAGVSGQQERSPVPFDDAVSTGLTGVDVHQAVDAGYQIPRVEVFFAQYQYVVGYYGVASAVEGLDGSGVGSQFGQPLAVFVTDYSRADPYLSDEGYLRVRTDPAVGWVRASEAVFVLDSDATTPGGPAVVPFADRAAAESFVDSAGGEIHDWAATRARLVDSGPDPETAFRSALENRSRWADEVVAQRRTLRERPVSVTVGADAPTLAAAIEQAPSNTTIALPPGTYDANLTVNKSLTIAGAGEQTVLAGDGNGSVLDLRAPETALLDLRLTGVGDRDAASYDGNATRWDSRIRQAYGGGDAAVDLRGANRSLLAGLTIETSASGVIARDSAGVVARNLTIDGTAEWKDGFMGVLSIASRMVIEDSTAVGGRDAVYLHDAPGTVVRDNTFRDLRYGVHEMYTGRTLLSNNTVSGANIGIVVMTRPTGNVLVGNHLFDNEVGLSVSGSASFAVENLVVGNERGIGIGTQRSLYTRNSVLDNDVGLRTGTILPTNTVTENDVVGNDRDVRTGRGPVRTFSDAGHGNYWGPVPGRDRDGDGVIERAYRPTGPIDSRVRDSPAVATLAASPAVDALRGFQQSVPGLRNADVIDPAPLSTPVRPDLLDATNRTGGGERP